jgi:hypothetical protein
MMDEKSELRTASGEEDNLYGDLLKIANGDFSVAEKRCADFTEYANRVSGYTEPESLTTKTKWYIRLACFIGFHDWIDLGKFEYVSLIHRGPAVTIRQCKHCARKEEKRVSGKYIHE